MFHSYRTLKAQLACSCVELRQCYTITERVVNPADTDRLWGDGQPGVDQSLIVAVAWPKHHAMLAKCDTPPITVRGDMTNREDCHNKARSQVNEPFIQRSQYVRRRFVTPN